MRLQSDTMIERRAWASADAVAPAPPVKDSRRSVGRGLRVLMVVESSAGGTGRHVLDLSASLIKRGCEVHLIYSTVRVDQMFLDRLRRIARDAGNGVADEDKSASARPRHGESHPPVSSGARAV